MALSLFLVCFCSWQCLASQAGMILISLEVEFWVCFHVELVFLLSLSIVDLLPHQTIFLLARERAELVSIVFGNDFAFSILAGARCWCFCCFVVWFSCGWICWVCWCWFGNGGVVDKSPRWFFWRNLVCGWLFCFLFSSFLVEVLKESLTFVRLEFIFSWLLYIFNCYFKLDI